MTTEKKISSVIRVFVISPLFTIYNGFVISKLWLWFLVPLGIFEIRIVQAIGISLIFSILKGFSISDLILNEDNVIPLWKIYLTGFIMNNIFLLSGFIYSQFL